MTHKNNYNRRQFLQTSALALAAAALPKAVFARMEGMNTVKSVATAGFKPDVELEITANKTAVSILSGHKTEVFKYSGKLLKGHPDTLQSLGDNYLGDRLNLQHGQKVRVFFHNQLGEPNIIHWHGLHVPQKSDGHPMYAVETGGSYVYEFEVENLAGTSFYHTHTHEMTARQVYKGLAGLITVTDSNEKKLELPHGEYDLPLVIQDRTFNADNQLIYVHRMPDRMMGFLGSTILVNGKPDTEFAVKSRAYRFRAVNGSNSRIYKLGWDDGTPLIAIGTDGHLLEKPETKPYIMLAPGERVDLWLDFSGLELGSRMVMYSLPYQGLMPAMYNMQHGRGRGHGRMGGMGMRMGGMVSGDALLQGSKFPIASFKVTEKVSDSPKLPQHLSTIKHFTDADVDNAQNPMPIGLSMGHMSPRINGRNFSMDRVDEIEKVALGSHKKIRIFHDHSQGGMGMGGMMNMAHPIHLHGQQYQVVSRSSTHVNAEHYATVNEGFLDKGWKDTVLVVPGEEIHIIKPFEDYTGLFLYHCHNLEHEDLGMMRQFYVS
jgi:bilirubin oxidase